MTAWQALGTLPGEAPEAADTETCGRRPSARRGRLVDLKHCNRYRYCNFYRSQFGFLWLAETRHKYCSLKAASLK